MAYVIRSASPADAPAIVGVARRTWQATYAGIIPEEVQARALADWYDEGRIARQAAAPGAVFPVAATGDGEIVGFAYAAPRPEPGDAELWRYYVLPEHQGKGIGRRLLAAVLDGLGGAVSRLFVQVEEGNMAGRRSYEALGFTYVRTYDDDLLGHPTRAVELCLHVQ